MGKTVRWIKKFLKNAYSIFAKTGRQTTKYLLRVTGSSWVCTRVRLKIIAVDLIIYTAIFWRRYYVASFTIWKCRQTNYITLPTFSRNEWKTVNSDQGPSSKLTCKLSCLSLVKNWRSPIMTISDWALPFHRLFT